MPAYDYRCRVCGVDFEVRRGITEDAPATIPCPGGHAETSRVFRAVAVGGVAAGGERGAPAAAREAGGGGCCGGGCCG